MEVKKISLLLALFFQAPHLVLAQESCEDKPDEKSPLDLIIESIEAIPEFAKAPPQPDIEIESEEHVFKGAKSEHEDCRYISGFEKDYSVIPPTLMRQQGWSLDSERQEEVLHCKSDGLVKMKLNMKPELCESTSIYAVLDRSGSMGEADSALKEMALELLELERDAKEKNIKVYISPSNPERKPFYISGKTSIAAAKRIFNPQAGSPHGLKDEEQGFLSMLHLIQQHPSSPECAQLVFLSDEEEQSKLEMTASTFLGKAQSLFGEKTWVKSHAFFAPENSKYAQASSESGGLLSRDKSFKELLLLAKYANLTFIFPPSDVAVVLTADLEETPEKNSMVGKSNGWIWLEDSKAFLYSQEDEEGEKISQVPEETFFRYLKHRSLLKPASKNISQDRMPTHYSSNTKNKPKKKRPPRKISGERSIQKDSD